MGELFLNLLNMSITAGWLVLAVVILRLLLRKAPKWISCVLWSLVGVRLVMPFSLESIFSLIPTAEPIAPVLDSGNLMVQPSPSVQPTFQPPVIQGTVNTPVIPQPLPDTITQTVEAAERMSPLETVLLIAVCVWVLGMVGMVIYSVVSYVRLKKRVGVSILHRENIYYCDDIATPFILGVFKPRIYLPSGMHAEQEEYVCRHEFAHLKRKDHWWKPIGFALLTVYWFNPLMWLAYILLCRDIEQACDEKVVKDMDVEEKKGYSEALVACSVQRRMIMACPLAFGEVGVKARIKSVLNYKKPAFWLLVVAIVACVAVALCFLTNPKKETPTPTPSPTPTATVTTTASPTPTATPTEDELDDDELPAEMANQIRQDYLTFLNQQYPSDTRTLEDIQIVQSFSTYRDTPVVRMGSDIAVTTVQRTVEFAEYKLIFPSGQLVYIYKDSQFYTVKEAYEAGILDKRELNEVVDNSGARGECVNAEPPAREDSPTEALRSVMLRENPFSFEEFTNVRSGPAGPRTLYLGDSLTFDEWGHHVSNFAVEDLDGDGISEVICLRYHWLDYIILRYQDGHVWGYDMSIRSFGHLKQDGSFEGYGDSQTQETDCRIQFKKDSEMLFIPRLKWGGLHPSTRSYSINYVNVDKETYDKATKEFDAKPDAVWYEYNEENVKKVLVEGNVISAPMSPSTSKLAAAVEAIQNEKFKFQEQGWENDDHAIRHISPVLRELVSEYGVEVLNLEILEWDSWSNYDEKNGFSGGFVCDFVVTITDGKNTLTVPQTATFGARQETPTVNETATATPTVKVTPTKTQKMTAKPTGKPTPKPTVKPTPVPTPTLLPVTERTDMLKGKPVQAIVKKIHLALYSPAVPDTGEIVISMAGSVRELKALYEDSYTDKRNMCWDEHGNQILRVDIDQVLQEYDEEFFRENAIIVVRMERLDSDGNYQYSLVKSKGEYCVEVDVVPWREDVIPFSEWEPLNTFIQVKKSDIANIEKLSYFEHDDKANS